MTRAPTGRPTVPGSPNVPDMPEGSDVPGSPNVAGAPGVQRAPDRPSVPGIPGIPGDSSVPGRPDVADGLDVPHVRLAGDPAEIGRRHGAARAPQLRAFLDDGLARLNHLRPANAAPFTLDDLGPTITAHREAVEGQTPDLAAEIRGLAEGAGLTADEAMLLQIRREVMGYSRIPTRGDCTTYARAGEVVAQTVDLNGDLDDQIAVLEITPAGSARRSLILSFAGLLGYLGMNSAGLAIGLNLLLGGTWRPGLPPYLAIRHLLDNAASVDEALTILAGLELSSSRSLTLCSPGKAAYVEILDDRTRVTEAPWTVHTNHYLHPDLAPDDEINVFARNSSQRRLDACAERLTALPPSAAPEEHFALLSAPPICVPDDGDIRLERTVAAVVMRPDQGRMYVRPGDPSHPGTRTHTFALD
ncbi:C45 family autoproteolytic acyltransferase/hydolase [Spirillospora sp. NPDC047279]|uniref:C45 family autoproteolytic acyltransferase/hydolase n=1 Tax=Spirillospora sp. NPDC047279 TaxID=3155478 RepID=UPI0034107D5F